MLGNNNVFRPNSTFRRIHFDLPDSNNSARYKFSCPAIWLLEAGLGFEIRFNPTPGFHCVLEKLACRNAELPNNRKALFDLAELAISKGKASTGQRFCLEELMS